MPKRLYIPEWDGVYPPSKKMPVDKTKKSKTILIRERKTLAEKCDTLSVCKSNIDCETCKIFLKLKELDKLIEKLEKKPIREVQMSKRKLKEPYVSRSKINGALKRIHRNQGDFSCICGIYRSQKINLIQHLSQNPDCVSRLLKIEFDKGETSLYKYSSLSSLENNICDICGREFANEEGVRIHKSKIH